MAELKIETKKGKVNKNVDEIFEFLTNMNNFEGLFYDNHIKNWKSTVDYCTFEVEGAGAVGFIIDEKTKPSKIVYKNYGNVPFEYKMTVLLSPLSDNETETGIIFEADVNPVLKMMLKNPLTNLLNTLITQLDNIKF